jgi:hypothetical protein
MINIVSETTVFVIIFMILITLCNLFFRFCFRGVYYFVKEVLPLFKKRKRSEKRIPNTSGGIYRENMYYSKAWLTDYVSAEYYRKNRFVNLTKKVN